jgi:hypothetical protein
VGVEKGIKMNKECKNGQMGGPEMGRWERAYTQTKQFNTFCQVLACWLLQKLKTQAEVTLKSNKVLQSNFISEQRLNIFLKILSQTDNI